MNKKFSLVLIIFSLFILILHPQETGTDEDFDTLLKTKARHDSIIMSRTSSDNTTAPNFTNRNRTKYQNQSNSVDSTQKNLPLLILLILAFSLIIVLIIIHSNLRKKFKNINETQDKKSQHKTRTLLKNIETQKYDLVRLRKIEGLYHSMQVTQKELEEEVKKSELLQKAIVAMKYPVVLTDLTGFIVFCNLEFAELHGYKASELLGRKILMLLPLDARFENTLENLESWENKVLTIVTQKKNGDDIELYSKSSLLRDTNNKPTSILTTYEKVPEVKEVVETVDTALLEEEKQRIFENIQDIYYEVTINGQIHDISNSISEISDIPREELIGKEMKVLYADEQQRKNFVAALKKEEDSIDYEIKLKGKKGSIVPCIITAKLILDKDEMPYLIVGSLRKISKRKQEEEKSNKALEDLKVVNKDLLDFAYITSHDLKSPLRAINTLANWVMMDEENKMGEEAKGQMQLLINRTERMHNLIDAIFDYTNIVSFDGEKSNINMQKMISGLKSRMKIPANISLKVKENMPHLTFEKSRIEQVFENIIENSVKYMDKDEGVIVVDWVERPKEYEFAVTDNGPGIDPKYFEKVFQIFQTLKPRDEVEGVGIGMAIVRKIITKYGGKIWLESVPGKSLTVSFTIPKTSE
jgi:PAS domain S-box-containing protein